MPAGPYGEDARERARLDALARYHVLDTEPEAGFDEITALAAHICGTPMAAVSLTSEHRQWFKARIGVDVCETGRDIAFCDHAVRSGQLFVVPDATLDPLFADNPMVTGEPYVRFYAGAPLVTDDGHVLGTLCVIDVKPRELTEVQLTLLTSLAHQTMSQLEHRTHAKALAASEGRWRAMVENSPVAVAVYGVDDLLFKYGNVEAAHLYGVDDPEDLVGRSYLEVIPPQNHDGFRKRVAQIATGVMARGMQTTIVGFDGRLTNVEVHAVQIGFNGSPAIQVELRDITARVAAEQRLREAHELLAEQKTQVEASAAFHDAVLAASPDLIFVVEVASGKTLWSSRNLIEMLGYTEQDLVDFGEAIVTTIAHPDDAVRLRAANQAVRDLDDGGVLQIRYRALHANGEYRWLSRRVTPFVRDEHGAVTQLLGVARDITDLVEVEERLRQAALEDALTGLPNRTLMADRLRSALSRSSRSGAELAVLFVDLDGFKHVNDTGGHAAGDEVLKVTADRLRASLRALDSVARVGGDEFVVLVEPAGHTANETDVRHDAGAVADRIKDALAEPIPYDGSVYRVTASVGITFAHAGADPDAVLRDADMAMYQAKSRGKNRCEVFDNAHQVVVQRRPHRPALLPD